MYIFFNAIGLFLRPLLGAPCPEWTKEGHEPLSFPWATKMNQN
jgi:hypothetical protein